MRGLRGKRIGNAPGTSGHNALLQGLSAAGMTDKDVVLVTMNVREMPDALVAGKIDAFAAFEPTPSSFLKTYPGQFVPLHRQVSPAYLVIPRQLTDKQPEVVYLLLAAVQRTTRWLNRSRSNLDLASKWTISGMRDFLGKDPELDVRDIATLTRTDFLDISGVPFIPLRDKNVDSPLGRTFENLRKSGKLPASVEWQQVAKNVDNSMNRHVHDNSSRYKINEFDYSQ